VQANARNVSFVVLVVAWCLSRACLGKSSVFHQMKEQEPRAAIWSLVWKGFLVLKPFRMR
jgi:hypothetical protein